MSDQLAHSGEDCAEFVTNELAVTERTLRVHDTALARYEPGEMRNDVVVNAANKLRSEASTLRQKLAVGGFSCAACQAQNQ